MEIFLTGLAGFLIFVLGPMLPGFIIVAVVEKIVWGGLGRMYDSRKDFMMYHAVWLTGCVFFLVVGVGYLYGLMVRQLTGI